MKIYSILLLQYILFCCFTLNAQTGVKRNTVLSISGTLHDLTRNITLEAASVALYKQGEDKVHSITLSSRTGIFVFENLPSYTSFRMQISRMGYKILEREISIRDSSINLGALYLSQRVNQIEEVEILSPVRMNGDTIEFNADAFRLDSNAMVGDLLIKLPGITIWGDNEITYNGKKINKLYVNGKDFFSTNMNISLQNIPKNIIDKVQIFDTDRDRRETKDINLVLKKGKDRGIFGKAGVGLGTKKNNELEVIMSLFNSSNQLSVARTKSNINKPLNNIDQLLNNTTFGGVNLNVNYFSDLRKRGYHEDSAYGMLFKHNFSDNRSGISTDNNELKVDIFQKSSNSLLQHNSNIIWLTSDELDNSTDTEEKRIYSFNNFLGKVNYKLKKDNRIDLDILANFEKKQMDNTQNRFRIGRINNVETREKDIALEDVVQDVLSLNTRMRIYGRSSLNQVKWYDNLDLEYNLLFNPSSSFVQIEKNIESTSSGFENRAFMRNSQVKKDLMKHDAFSKLERIFPSKLNGIVNVDIGQRIQLTHNKSDYIVRDSLKINKYLTYDEDESKLYSTSSLSLGRKFILDRLYMRYERSVGFYSNFDLQLTKDDVKSGYLDRSMYRTNTFIKPSIRMNYLHKIEQNFVKDISLSWNISYDIPSIGMISPVVDNINILNQTYGNPNLDNSKSNNVALQYIFTNLNPTGLNLDMSFHVKLTNNGFIPNIEYKKDGRREVYFMNDKNLQSNYISSINLRKAYKMSPNNNFTVKLFNTSILSTNRQVINEDYIRLESLNYNGKLDLMFNFSDYIKLGAYQQFDYFQQKNKASTNFKNKTSDTNLSLGIGLRKKVFFNTSISYLNVENINNSNGVFLWNISASYRALKKNNLEIKLSALDILNNNSSINTSSTNTYTIYETNNIIRRYIMLNLSYFPRFF